MHLAESIARALGARRVGAAWMACCPAHDDGTPSLSIASADGKVLLRCHAGCTQNAVITALRARNLWAPPSSLSSARNAHVPVPVQRVKESRIRVALRIWRSTLPGKGSIIERYLRNRGLDMPVPARIRFHPHLKHPDGTTWPGMVALVTNAEDKPVAIHRTYLALNGGGKAPVVPQKMMLGPCGGGAVRLARTDGYVMIGEGIETCLAAMLATGAPAWAALSTSGLRTLDLPAATRKVTVLADGDDPGEAAAQACAHRWSIEGRTIAIARPPCRPRLQRFAFGGRRNGAVVRMSDTTDDKSSGNVVSIRNAIASAQNVPSWTDELVVRAATDAGAALDNESLKALRALQRASPAEFERVRAKLREVGCRMTVLDAALKGLKDDDAIEEPDEAPMVVISREIDAFHTPDGTGYADIEVNGHRETWPARSSGLKRWLIRRFYEHTGTAPSSETLSVGVNLIDAKAVCEGPERQVHVRVGSAGDKLYLDLCDRDWRAIEIDAEGWRVVERPAVRFRRSAGMLSLPMPQKGGSISALRALLNVKSEADFVLVVGWLLAGLRDRGPYPALVVSGEQGSAKTTFCTLVRSLIDPNTAALRALPREDRDLFIAAINGHVLAYDNVSNLPPWTSDTLCRLATGGGFATRRLHTDQEEVLFDAQRPVMLNGIANMVSRPDLADRSLLLTLQTITDDARRTAAEVRTQFEAEHPRVLGALLDAVVVGLRGLPDVKLDRLPRMADFAAWVTACEPALWPAGTFAAAYGGNRDDAIEEVIEADPVAMAVRGLMAKRSAWTGTATELLEVLGEIAGDRTVNAPSWPGHASALSNRVRRAATFLRKGGIEVAEERHGHGRKRLLHITVAGMVLESGAVRGEPGTVGADGADGADGDLHADDSNTSTETTPWKKRIAV